MRKTLTGVRDAHARALGEDWFLLRISITPDIFSYIF